MVDAYKNFEVWIPVLPKDKYSIHNVPTRHSSLFSDSGSVSQPYCSDVVVTFFSVVASLCHTFS